jgi:hypothetical protein
MKNILEFLNRATIDPIIWCRSGVRGIIPCSNYVTNEKEIRIESALISKKCLETLPYYNRTSSGEGING